MIEDINELSKRANVIEQAKGFVACYVHSETNRELAFEFDSDENANIFCVTRQGQNFNAFINDSSPNIVIVIQP